MSCVPQLKMLAKSHTGRTPPNLEWQEICSTISPRAGVCFLGYKEGWWSNRKASEVSERWGVDFFSHLPPLIITWLTPAPEQPSDHLPESSHHQPFIVARVVKIQLESLGWQNKSERGAQMCLTILHRSIPMPILCGISTVLADNEQQIERWWQFCLSR